MEFTELSDSELEVMEVLWREGRSVSFGELLEYFNVHTDKKWKKQTLNTFLFRMQQKSLLQVLTEGRYKQYLPAMTKDEYLLAEARAFLDKHYQGSIVKMVAAFSGSDAFGKEEAAGLKKVAEEWEKKGTAKQGNAWQVPEGTGLK